MKPKSLITKLRTESLYKDKATLEIMDLCMEAAAAIECLQMELDNSMRERDAAICDINSILRNCDCEVRHEYCKFRYSDDCDGCDLAEWRGIEG